MSAAAQPREPHAGKRLTETTFTVDDAVLESHCAGLDLPRGAGTVVPSTVVSKPDNDYILEAGFSNRFGHLWVRQAWEFFRPLERGSTYRVEGDIRDIYERRDRNVVQFEARLLDRQGTLVARSQHHQSFLKDTPASGEVTLRDPGQKPGARTFEVPAGERFGGLERRITVEMCGTFFHGKSNYHTDRDASAALGFKDIVVGGRMTLAYAAHVLEERFGAAWWTSGRLDVKFTNPVWVDETVRAHGVATGPVPEAPDRAGAFVWVDKPDGTVVLVGTASVARG